MTLPKSERVWIDKCIRKIGQDLYDSHGGGAWEAVRHHLGAYSWWEDCVSLYGLSHATTLVKEAWRKAERTDVRNV